MMTTMMLMLMMMMMMIGQVLCSLDWLAAAVPACPTLATWCWSSSLSSSLWGWRNWWVWHRGGWQRWWRWWWWKWGVSKSCKYKSTCEFTENKICKFEISVNLHHQIPVNCEVSNIINIPSFITTQNPITKIKLLNLYGVFCFHNAVSKVNKSFFYEREISQRESACHNRNKKYKCEKCCFKSKQILFFYEREISQRESACQKRCRSLLFLHPFFWASGQSCSSITINITPTTTTSIFFIIVSDSLPSSSSFDNRSSCCACP